MSEIDAAIHVVMGARKCQDSDSGGELTRRVCFPGAGDMVLVALFLENVFLELVIWFWLLCFQLEGTVRGSSMLAEKTVLARNTFLYSHFVVVLDEICKLNLFVPLLLNTFVLFGQNKF